MSDDTKTPIDPLSMVAPELVDIVAAQPPVTYSAELLPIIRESLKTMTPPLPDGVKKHSIPGAAGAPPVDLLIADPWPDQSDKPAVLFMHGGGFVVQSAQDFAPFIANMAQACQCVVVSVDYRLAPETPYPGALMDCYSTLQWMRDPASALGIDANRLALAGVSAGGGLAAQLSFMARDQGIPIAFQLLIYPMLDDRTGGEQPVPPHIGHYIWNAGSNQFAWGAYLGENNDDAKMGAVPARIDDVSGLAPAWIGVGSADLFMAENLSYAQRLIEAGVNVEVHVVPGGVHAFDVLASQASITEKFNAHWQTALAGALTSTVS